MRKGALLEVREGEAKAGGAGKKVLLARKRGKRRFGEGKRRSAAAIVDLMDHIGRFCVGETKGEKGGVCVFALALLFLWYCILKGASLW